MNNLYPKLIFDARSLKNNMAKVVDMCHEKGVVITGVTKGASGLLQVGTSMLEGGCESLGSSRLGHLEIIKDFNSEIETMLVRLPSITQAKDTIRFADISLNSEVSVLEALNSEAQKQNKIHKVILMADLGDLREGFWNDEELLDVSIKIENEFGNLHLLGVGTNVGCYGSISPTPEKLNELVIKARKVENIIGRKLEYISGGATSSLLRIIEDNLPAGINHFRIGEGILLARDLEDLWGYDMSFLNRDVFKLEAEVIEVKVKASHPQGEMAFDAYGGKPTFEDRGDRKRAILALGKADYAFHDMIFPFDKNIEVLGASSDHTLLDVEDVEYDIKVGDIVSFNICYASMVYLTNSKDVNIETIGF